MIGDVLVGDGDIGVVDMAVVGAVEPNEYPIGLESGLVDGAALGGVP